MYGFHSESQSNPLFQTHPKFQSYFWVQKVCLLCRYMLVKPSGTQSWMPMTPGKNKRGDWGIAYKSAQKWYIIDLRHLFLYVLLDTRKNHSLSKYTLINELEFPLELHASANCTHARDKHGLVALTLDQVCVCMLEVSHIPVKEMKLPENFKCTNLFIQCSKHTF